MSYTRIARIVSNNIKLTVINRRGNVSELFQQLDLLCKQFWMKHYLAQYKETFLSRTSVCVSLQKVEARQLKKC